MGTALPPDHPTMRVAWSGAEGVPIFMPDRLLTVEESRKRLQVSRATLYHLINSGHLQSVLLGPQSRRIVESSVDALIAARAHVMELVAPASSPGIPAARPPRSPTSSSAFSDLPSS